MDMAVGVVTTYCVIRRWSVLRERFFSCITTQLFNAHHSSNDSHVTITKEGTHCY